MKLVLFLKLVFVVSCVEGSTFSISDYGATGDGETDDRKSLENAWAAACNQEDAVVLIPGGKTFLISQITLKGPCKPNLTLKVSGNIQAPSASEFSNSNTSPWIRIKALNDGFTVDASGSVDGNGGTWWQRDCGSCRKAPNSVEFKNINNLQVNGLYVKNSPRMHISINTCQQVTLNSPRINSPGSSPNTDGIHITNSQDVVIKNAEVAAGDDCISIVAGSSNVNIDTITCGPGHGISIGSLGGGSSNEEEDVSDVHVSNANLQGTKNGVRIKTYKTGRGSVSDITFSDISMDNVENPIIIDQEYCDSKSHKCSAAIGRKAVGTSGAIRISNVVYKNISGTSKSETAVTLDCSETEPCTGIELDNIQLYGSDDSDLKSVCANAFGEAEGEIVPKSCLANA